MAIGEPKPEIKESTEKYIEFGDLSLSKEGYIRWLNNATSELRKEFLNILANSAKSGQTIAELGDEIIKRVVIDKKNLEMSDADIKDEAVRSAKKTMLVVVDSIRHLEPKQKEKVINIAPQERPTSALERPISGIEKVSQEQIKNEVEQIKLLFEELKKDSLTLLKSTFENYKNYKEIDSRVTELISKDFDAVKELCVSDIDKRLSEIPESDEIDILMAKRNIVLLKEKIMEINIELINKNELNKESGFKSIEEIRYVDIDEEISGDDVIGEIGDDDIVEAA